ncbi:amino acid permease, partial [Acinetobacter baumannii]
FEAFKRIAFGQPLSQHAVLGQRLGRAQALAILSSDALSSVAYGTEASLAVLLVGGTAALSANLGIGLVIVLLMAVVANSY